MSCNYQKEWRESLLPPPECFDHLLIARYHIDSLVETLSGDFASCQHSSFEISSFYAMIAFSLIYIRQAVPCGQYLVCVNLKALFESSRLSFLAARETCAILKGIPKSILIRRFTCFSQRRSKHVVPKLSLSRDQLKLNLSYS
jgi:hypothetical protein